MAKTKKTIVTEKELSPEDVRWAVIKSLGWEDEPVVRVDFDFSERLNEDPELLRCRVVRYSQVKEE